MTGVAAPPTITGRGPDVPTGTGLAAVRTAAEAAATATSGTLPGANATGDKATGDIATAPATGAGFTAAGETATGDTAAGATAAGATATGATATGATATGVGVPIGATRVAAAAGPGEELGEALGFWGIFAGPGTVDAGTLDGIEGLAAAPCDDGITGTGTGVAAGVGTPGRA
jgi:hypothetical protein